LLFSLVYMVEQNCAILPNAPLLASQIRFVSGLSPFELLGMMLRPVDCSSTLTSPRCRLAGLRLVIGAVRKAGTRAA
jgi:hypothetical protein